MCQYYQWTCSCCMLVNECVVQCATAAVNQQRCLRYGDCLPLPQNAPPLRCVHCHQVNKAVYPTVHQNAARGPQLHLQYAQPQVKKPFQGLDDPAIAKMLAGYDEQRAGVFAAANKGPKNDQSPGKSAAWEDAWDELRSKMIGTMPCATNAQDQTPSHSPHTPSRNGHPNTDSC